MTQGAERSPGDQVRTPPAAGPTPDPGGALLRASTRVAIAAAVFVTAVSAVWGVPAAVSAAIGGLLAVAAVAVGPLLLRATRNASPRATTAVALGGYVGVLVILAGLVALLVALPWVSAVHLVVALALVTLAGTGAQVRAVTRLRTLVFDERAPEHDRGRSHGSGGGNP